MAQAAADDAANSVLLARTEVQNAKVEVQNAQAEVVNAQNEVAKAEQEVVKAKAEVQNAKNEVQNAKAEVINAQTEVANAHAEFLNAQGEVAKAAQEVVKAKAEVTNAQAEVVNAQTEVQNAKNEVQNAKAEVQNAKAEVEKSRIWSEGTDAEVTAQGGTHSCREWLYLVQQATIGSFPITVTGIATANQTVLPLNLEEPISSVDQVLTVIVENTALLPENYAVSSNGQSVVLLNPLAAGERWCVKCLYDLQSMGGIIDCVVYEEM